MPTCQCVASCDGRLREKLQQIYQLVQPTAWDSSASQEECSKPAVHPVKSNHAGRPRATAVCDACNFATSAEQMDIVTYMSCTSGLPRLAELQTRQSLSPSDIHCLKMSIASVKHSGPPLKHSHWSQGLT